jgi:lipoate-protein ligase A
MAVDEALLLGYTRERSTEAPTLRLYSWDPPALSLGRCQEASTSSDPAYLREQGIDLVRRPTGGRAVLHEWERTYSVTGSLLGAPFDHGVRDVYGRIADALLAALRRLGLEVGRSTNENGAVSPRDRSVSPACFEAPSVHEILSAGRKVVGSAQLRRRGAFLQHGSILLDSSAERLAAAVGSPTSDLALTGLRRLLGRRQGESELDRALALAFADCFDSDLEPGELTEIEAQRAARLRCWKYDSAAWTIDGRPGDRETHWGPDLSF